MTLESLRTDDLLQILEDIASEISRNKDYLTELDSIGGDGDHGVNLERGFKQVQSQLQQLRSSQDVGSILTTVGTTLLSTIGGATGSLYGSAFIKAGSVCRDKTEIKAKDLPEIFTACSKAIADLGGAKAGDKTMLDVILPATEVVTRASKESTDLVFIFADAARAAKEGLQSTKSMVAKKGRAMYLGERTLGHCDTGAASLCLMLESCARTVSTLK